MVNNCSLIDLFLPYYCLLCSSQSTLAMNLCSACLDELPWIEHACRLCGLPIYGSPVEHIHENQICGACLKQPPPFGRSLSVFTYEFPIRQLINRFKSNQQVRIGTTLGKLLAMGISAHYFKESLGESLDESLKESLPDLIVPVPLNWRKIQLRGFNQAHLIAKTLSRELKIPLQPGLIKQVRQTQPQKGLGRKERARNLQGAYRVTNKLSGQNIALVDDVVTTMATAVESTQLLKMAGAGEVHIWSVARTLPFGGA